MYQNKIKNKLCIYLNKNWKYCEQMYVIKKNVAQRLECSPMARETWVQSQVESYQRL